MLFNLPSNAYPKYNYRHQVILSQLPQYLNAVLGYVQNVADLFCVCLCFFVDNIYKLTVDDKTPETNNNEKSSMFCIDWLVLCPGIRGY